jgi:hypothetical protein
MVEDLAKLVKMAEMPVQKHSEDITDIYKSMTHMQRKVEESHQVIA